MKFALQLLKELFFVICNVIWTVIKTLSVPVYTTSVKVLLISLCLWCLAKYAPHGLPFVSDISFFGWVTIIVMYRMITLKYDDFNDEEDPTPELPETPNYLQDETTDNDEPSINVPIPPRNIGLKNNDTTTSTRE